jgi:RNA polymerase sigma-70 factor (ECF subfamily)
VTTPETPPALAQTYCTAVREARLTFLRCVDPHRPDLFRYCRSLTRSPWDAEDLVQETLLRAYAKLAEVWIDGVQNPKSYLFRIATNAWIDQQRRERGVRWVDEGAADEASAPRAPAAFEVREALCAAAALLPPRERVSLLLKDVFDYSLEEIAAALDTTVGAVKAALHRAREKAQAHQRSSAVSVRAAAPRSASQDAAADTVIDAFSAAFARRDMDAVIAFFLDDASGSVAGTVQEWNREEMRRGSWGHTVYTRDGKPQPLPYPKGERVVVGGEPLFVLWSDERTIDDVVRFKIVDGRIAGFTSYYFCPDVLAEIAVVLGVQSNDNRYFA